MGTPPQDPIIQLQNSNTFRQTPVYFPGLGTIPSLPSDSKPMPKTDAEPFNLSVQNFSQLTVHGFVVYSGEKGEVGAENGILVNYGTNFKSQKIYFLQKSVSEFQTTLRWRCL